MYHRLSNPFLLKIFTAIIVHSLCTRNERECLTINFIILTTFFIAHKLPLLVNIVVPVVLNDSASQFFIYSLRDFTFLFSLNHIYAGSI